MHAPTGPSISCRRSWGIKPQFFPQKKAGQFRLPSFFVYRYVCLALHALSNVGICIPPRQHTVAEHTLDALDDDGSALANTNAHGAQSILAAGTLQLIHGSRYQTCT